MIWNVLENACFGLSLYSYYGFEIVLMMDGIVHCYSMNLWLVVEGY